MGRHVKFNQAAYIRALEKALASAMNKVEREVFESIVANFGALDFRELDTKYITEMRRAIRYATVRTTNRILSQFRAGYEGMPNQSFRLVYYEYGTGQLMRPPVNYSPSSDSSWNKGSRPQRVGESIWTRPYGSWTDAGGNEHFSKYRGKPMPLNPKVRTARPIPPSFWFSRGFWQGASGLDRYVLDAVKSVHISPYISIANIYKRM